MSVFEGLSAFPITPADEAGCVDTMALTQVLGRLKTADIQSVGLLGSTGTYAYLSRTERQRTVAAAVEYMDGACPVIVGVGALRTDDAKTLARDAENAGADALLLAPVSYTPLTDEEVYQHYSAVATTVDLPICIYNNPGTTGFTFGPELLERLGKIPAFTAVKMPLPPDDDFAGQMRQLREVLPDDFLIGYSGDWGCGQALLDGAQTWYSVIAGLLPGPAAALVRAATSGDTVTTKQLNVRLDPFWTLFQEFGSLRVIYAAANVLSITTALPPRPILPLTAAAVARVEQALDAIGEGPKGR